MIQVSDFVRNLKMKFKRRYLRILNSLIFYPSLLVSIFFVVSSAILSYEDNSMGQSVQDNFSYLYLQDTDTARTILTTLVASILSLMVFSFSMVMVVLSQASSNYSPRLLPQLISDKKRQIILGFYAGTILHCVLTLISLGSKNPSENSIGLSTMIAAILGIICMILFIYFIQNISSVIRIDIIVKVIFYQTKDLIVKQLDKESDTIDTDYSDWIAIRSKRTGYFKGLDTDVLLSSVKQTENSIHVVPYEYEHIWEGDVVLWIKNSVDDKTKENLLLCMTIIEDRFKGESLTSGLIKLMEIAVKAMSPGINDPGTAVDVLYKIGRLLNKALQLPNSFKIDIGSKTSLTLTQSNIDEKELIRLIIRPIRNYSKTDTLVNVELTRMLNYLLSNLEDGSAIAQTITKELKMVKEDIKKHYKNTTDQEELLTYFID